MDDSPEREPPLTIAAPGRLLMGLLMLAGGVYLFLANIQVLHAFNLGHSLYSFAGGYSLTTGMVLIPLLFGIGLIFYNPNSDIGWWIAILSIAALAFGIISSLQLRLRPMSAFDLIVITTLMVGGLGLSASAFRREK
jgi:hypothetical protein